MKMQKTKDGWIIIDKGVTKPFDNAHDAWQYIFLMKEIRPRPRRVPKSVYPVSFLDPFQAIMGVTNNVLPNR